MCLRSGTAWMLESTLSWQWECMYTWWGRRLVSNCPAGTRRRGVIDVMSLQVCACEPCAVYESAKWAPACFLGETWRDHFATKECERECWMRVNGKIFLLFKFTPTLSLYLSALIITHCAFREHRQSLITDLCQQKDLKQTTFSRFLCSNGGTNKLKSVFFCKHLTMSSFIHLCCVSATDSKHMTGLRL